MVGSKKEEQATRYHLGLAHPLRSSKHLRAPAPSSSSGLHAMSADLFAEFSAPPPKQQAQQSQIQGQTGSSTEPSFSFFDDLSTNAPAPVAQAQLHQPSTGFPGVDLGKKEVASTDENDDWGDFEGGDSSFEPAATVKEDPFVFAAVTPSQPAQPSWVPALRQNDSFAFQSAQLSQTSQSAWPSSSQAQDDPLAFTVAHSKPSQEAWTPAPVIKAKKSADPSVLFDADEDLDDDDFGDFEGTSTRATPAAAATQARSTIDLLGGLSLSPQPAAPSPTSSREKSKSPSGGFGAVAQRKKSKASPPPSTAKQDDSWETFDDWEATIPVKAPAKPETKKQPEVTIQPGRASNLVPILSPTIGDPSPGELPPINVPPPAVLLTLFPPLFAEAQNKLFKPMAAQTLPMRNKLLSEPDTITFLQGYLMLASVAAQIIAGRKLRWKRDQHLSQGMRIGPASSRATSGMKLSTVDKSENLKEEREVLDVVRAWKDQVGRLRHVVSAANQVKAGTLGAVPDIQESMAVKALSQGEGGVPAPQPCMLCGLKREERVGSLDVTVEDSFGEWWIDQVNMHRGTYALREEQK